jgi:hypothetical protein
MIRARAAAAAALLLWQLLPAPAASAAETRITGTVVNGTSGGPSAEGLVVIASQLDSDGEEVSRQRAESGAGGAFSITGFDLEKGRRLLVGTDYLGVTYSKIIEEAPAPEVQVELTVYETTEDAGVVSLASDVMTIVAGRDDTFEVIQLQRFVNSSDRTFVGKQSSRGREVLSLPIPVGAFDLVPLEGFTPEGSQSMRGGITTASPLIPGNSSISWVYKIRAPRNWQMSRLVFYPTRRADLLAESSLNTQSERFEFEERVPLSGKEYRRFRGGPFEAGDTIEATIATATASPGAGLAVGLIAAFALLAIAGAVTMSARRRGRNRSARDSLVAEIAALDEAFQAGEVAEADYRDTRAGLKDHLERLTPGRGSG